MNKSLFHSGLKILLLNSTLYPPCMQRHLLVYPNRGNRNNLLPTDLHCRSYHIGQIDLVEMSQQAMCHTPIYLCPKPNPSNKYRFHNWHIRGLVYRPMNKLLRCPLLIHIPIPLPLAICNGIWFFYLAISSNLAHRTNLCTQQDGCYLGQTQDGPNWHPGSVPMAWPYPRELPPRHSPRSLHDWKLLQMPPIVLL